MQTGVVVAVVLSSLSDFACINGTEELAPSAEGTRSLNAARKSLSSQKYQEAITQADTALRLGVPRHQKKWIFRVKGEALMKLDRPREALVFLNTVRVQFSDDAVFLSRLAQAEVQTGNPLGGKRLEGLATDKMMPDANARISVLGRPTLNRSGMADLYSDQSKNVSPSCASVDLG